MNNLTIFAVFIILIISSYILYLFIINSRDNTSNTLNNSSITSTDSNTYKKNPQDILDKPKEIDNAINKDLDRAENIKQAINISSSLIDPVSKIGEKVLPIISKPLMNKINKTTMGKRLF